MDLEIHKEGLVNEFFTEYTTWRINKKNISKEFDYFWRFGQTIKITDEE